MALSIGGCCTPPNLSWQAQPPSDVPVRGSAEAAVTVDRPAPDLAWRASADWATVQPSPAGAKLVAAPLPGSSGAHELQVQARRGSGRWSKPLPWRLQVTPRPLQPVVTVLGDEGCTAGPGDGQTDQRFVGGSRTFVVSLGRTFDLADITAAEIWVDTDSLNNLALECRQGTTAFCPDSIRVDGAGAA